MTLDLRQLRETVSQSPEPVPLTGREHTFEVSYDAPGGQFYASTLVSRILDADERVGVARIAARRAGCPWDHLPAAHAARIWAIATLALQLRDPPAWVSQWALEDDSLLFAIYDVLQQHESFFFRGDGGASGAGAGKPRVAVSSTLSTRSAAEPS